MRIAFFTTRMVLGYGVDLTIHEIARRLVARGHEVDVWTPTSDGTYANEAYRLREIIVYGERVNRVLALLERNARTALRKLRAALDEEGMRYDVVVPCTHPYYAAGEILEVPQVFFNFGNVPTEGFSWRGKLNWAWLDLAEQLAHKPASARVVSISHFLHEQQPLEVRQKGRVVPLGGDHYWLWNGSLGNAPARPAAGAWQEKGGQEVGQPAVAVTDLQSARNMSSPANPDRHGGLSHPSSDQLSGDLPVAPTEQRARLRADLRAELGIDPYATVIGYCGRLHRDHPRYKGLTELLEIGRQIREREPGVELLLCGIGSEDDRRWIESYGAKALLNAPPQRMPAYYSALDIYATASRWEGFDLPIVEAVWHGVPAVAYNVGAHSEHVTAVLVHDVRASELGRALLTLVRDVRTRRELAAQAYRKAREFSWDRSAALFEEVLREVAP